MAYIPPANTGMMGDSNPYNYKGNPYGILTSELIKRGTRALLGAGDSKRSPGQQNTEKVFRAGGRAVGNYFGGNIGGALGAETAGMAGRIIAGKGHHVSSKANVKTKSKHPAMRAFDLNVKGGDRSIRANRDAKYHVADMLSAINPHYRFTLNTLAKIGDTDAVKYLKDSRRSLDRSLNKYGSVSTLGSNAFGDLVGAMGNVWDNSIGNNEDMTRAAIDNAMAKKDKKVFSIIDKIINAKVRGGRKNKSDNMSERDKIMDALRSYGMGGVGDRLARHFKHNMESTGEGPTGKTYAPSSRKGRHGKTRSDIFIKDPWQSAKTFYRRKEGAGDRYWSTFNRIASAIPSAIPDATPSSTPSGSGGGARGTGAGGGVDNIPKAETGKGEFRNRFKLPRLRLPNMETGPFAAQEFTGTRGPDIQFGGGFEPLTTEGHRFPVRTTQTPGGYSTGNLKAIINKSAGILV